MVRRAHILDAQRHPRLDYRTEESRDPAEARGGHGGTLALYHGSGEGTATHAQAGILSRRGRSKRMESNVANAAAQPLDGDFLLPQSRIAGAAYRQSD